MLSTKEVAKLMGVSPTRIRQFVEDGRLKVVLVGNSFGFHERDVQHLMQVKRVHGRPAKVEVE